MGVSGFLGRALMDPATGLPNIPYFCLVQEWEERRARRRGYSVRVISVRAESDDDQILQSLSWRLCQELRTSDLIASEGRNAYRILLTSPDSENVDAITKRISAMASAINDQHANAKLRLDVRVHAPTVAVVDAGPCDPRDESILDADPPS